MICTALNCNCHNSTTPLTEAFCAVCGHAMEKHQHATRSTVVQRACTQCSCANFTGAPGAQFCAACGHAATAHLTTEGIAMMIGAASAASPTMLAPAFVTKKARAPFPTNQVVTIGGIAAIAAVIIVGTTFALSWASSSASNTMKSADTHLAQSQANLKTATDELKSTQDQAKAAAAESRKLERKIASAVTDRSRLPRQIAVLRAQQQQLQQSIDSADYSPVPQ